MGNEKKKIPFALQIFLGLCLGILAGLLLMGHVDVAKTYIQPFGTLFLNLLKFVVVPIVLFSIMDGVISMQDLRKVGSIGVKTIVYYTCTTAFAVFIGLLLANLFKDSFVRLSTEGLEYSAQQSPSFLETLVGMFPSNVVAPMSDANMLQVIVMALFFGFGAIIAGEKSKAFAAFVSSANEVSMQVMNIIIKVSPIGVFALITPVVAENGPGILGSLALVLVVAYIAYLLHMALVYSATVSSLAKVSPLKFFSGMLPAMMMGFSSASSVGSLPLNLECVEKLGAKKEVASFVLPLGATINMDGTAIYQGVCAIFIATCYNVDLSLSQQLTIILTATLASIGTAGVPGAGLVMLTMVLTSVGLPIEGIALVTGIDRIFDMGRTTVNITGDAACALVVSKMEERREAKKRQQA